MYEKRKISVTVGWSGQKVHPAYQFIDGNGKSFIATACNCPHTNSGHKKLNPVADGWDHADCGQNRRQPC